MAKIKSIEGAGVLSTSGLPTVEITVVLSDGKIGVASCSTDENMGREQPGLEDLNNQNLFRNQSVGRTIGNIKNIIVSSLVGKEAERQPEIDKIMIDLDGTQNKSRLGADVMFAISMAVAKAAAESSCLPLFMHLKQFLRQGNSALKIPIPIFNFINGSSRGSRVSDFHEFIVIPASSKSYLECIQIGEDITKSLKKIIESKYTMTPDDYSESFTPNLSSNKEAFSLIGQAIGNTSSKLGFDVFFGLNSRASTFRKDGKYRIKDFPTGLSSKDMIDYYLELNKNIHLLYLEDPLDQEDWDGWTSLFAKISGTTIIAGGDLIATNPYRLQIAIERKTVNAIVVKPNQIGTVIESLAIAQAAREAGMKVVVSHRSNETNDDFLSDFSVAASADYVKLGSLSKGENIAKYNRLLQIENQLKIL